MPTTCEKAVRLFTYLKELSKLRTTHTKDITKYDKVLWFSEFPREKSCRCVAWELCTDSDDEREGQLDTWIEVHKPRLKSPPEVPDDLEPWIKEEEVSDSSLEEPGLYDQIISVGDPNPETGEEQTETLLINDHTDIFEMWLHYVDDKWKPWAQEDRRLQRIQTVYNDLYTIYQQAEKLGERYEVVVGLGFLLWRSPNSGDIRHPLLAFKATLAFDPVRGIISVGPALDGPDAKLEIDMLETEDRPGAQDQQTIEAMVNQLNAEPWDGPALEAILKSLANGVSTKSRYDRSLSRPAQISDVPQLHFAPSLILRERTRRTFVDFHAKIVDLLEAKQSISEGARRLVEIVDDEKSIYPRDPGEYSLRSEVGDTEIYFPLPANEEQKQVARRIEQRAGILVQGPPGTGKSHTITNLIAHLLARGSRVLVTSETPRALEVLKEMLPEEIRELCVMWLGSGAKAQSSLEQSVNGITQRKVTWDSESAASEIATFESRLEQVRKDQAKLRSELTACRESETYHHQDMFGNYSGTLEKIAARVNYERPRYGWFWDCAASGEEPAATSDELLELLEMDRLMTDDLEREMKMPHVPSDSLICPAGFRELVLCEQAALSSHKEAEKRRRYAGYESLQSLSPEIRTRMLNLLKGLVASMEQLAKHFQGWVDRAAREIVAGQDRVWRHLLEVTDGYLQELSDRSQEVSSLRIVGLENRDYSEVALHARKLKDHLDSGKRLGVLGLFKAKAVRQGWYLVKKVRVEGEPCRSAAPLQRLLEWLHYERSLRELADLWRTYATPPEGDYAARLAVYADLIEPLRDAVPLRGTVHELKELLARLPDLASPRWHARDDVHALLDAIQAVDIDERLAKAREAFAPLERRIAEVVEHNDAHPSAQQILNAVRQRDAAVYKEAYDEASRVDDLVERYELTRDALWRFKGSAPKTAAEYERTCRDELWNDRFRDFRAAWNWARTDLWLRKMCDNNRPKELIEAVESYQADERDILKKLAAAKAWQHSMTALGEPERQSLIAWMQAVRKIRGGTGRHAERHREEARQKLAECRRAIPAWVMPLYQVVQTTSPQEGLFDVAIVDEASQSGPDALLLHYIADRIIVVGDDKQIAPLHTGINRDHVTRLRQIHLKGIPHSGSFDLESSLFSQAELRFPDRVRLREHFRCMPEIIQFSNRWFYSTEPLIPLRQFGADRLEPCRTTHVPDGYRTGEGRRIVNRPEAKALVNQIVQCLEDSAYEGKSFGVISLLGDAQAPLIANLLMREVGAEEIERRKLLCGRPYDFQGDERHVMFLSMVDAPQDGKMCRMVRDRETQRRFNVAASRAKDQLWLFHSPTLNDLRTDCLRYRLLEHCLNPSVEQTQVGDLDVDALRRLAASEERGRREPPQPFDPSWFEVDVFLRIAERGYRVLPQYKVGRRRIDLVVQGLERMLAVECYGDEWHGPDQFHKDLERQRQLERNGWIFCIVWGSQFYRDPDAALQPLWEELEKQRIYPEHSWGEERRRKEESCAYIAGDFADEPKGEPALEGSDDDGASTPDKEPAEQPSSDHRQGGKQRLETISARAIRNAIIAALQQCPNNTCTLKSITSRVLKQLGIITRGNPRLEFERRVRRNIGVLKHEGCVEEYKSKNRRLRLGAHGQEHT